MDIISVLRIICLQDVKEYKEINYISHNKKKGSSSEFVGKKSKILIY